MSSQHERNRSQDKSRDSERLLKHTTASNVDVDDNDDDKAQEEIKALKAQLAKAREDAKKANLVLGLERDRDRAKAKDVGKFIFLVFVLLML